MVSACEGLQVATASVTRQDIVGISCGILVALFLIQRFGTSVIGYLFSPIASIWCARRGFGLGISAPRRTSAGCTPYLRSCSACLCVVGPATQ